MSTPSSLLPHRLRETSFRKYESVITEATKRWPAPITITPKEVGLSPTTFAARLRDAIKSLQQFQWTTTVDMARFCQVSDDMVVSHQGEEVIVGSAETVKPRKGMGDPWPDGFVKHVDLPGHEFPTPIDSPPIMLLQSVIVCLHHRLLQGPIEFINAIVSDELIKHWENNWDVSITYDSTTQNLTIV